MSSPTVVSVDAAFHMFDLDGKGKVTLPNAVLAFGYAGIVADLSAVHSALGIESPSKMRLQKKSKDPAFTLAQFQDAATKLQSTSTDQSAALKLAFQHLCDKGKSSLSAEQFGHFLTSIGDPISKADVEILFDSRGIKGDLTEAQFVQLMNAKQ